MRVLLKIPNRINKLSGSFFPEPYTIVAVNGSQVTVRRPAGDKLFKRDSSFVKRYVARDFVKSPIVSRGERPPPGAACDFVEPLSVPRSESLVAAPPQDHQTEHSSAEAVDQCTEYRTRSGRLVVRPQWYGNVRSH